MNGLEQTALMVGLVAGIGGLVLGIVNLLHQLRESRPRLQVRPFAATAVTRLGDPHTYSTSEDVAGVNIANVGKVPVHGGLVAFKGRDGDGEIVLTPGTLDEGAWPRSIEPGAVAVVRIDLDSAIANLMGKRRRLFVTSQVGDCYWASRRAMRAFDRQLHDVANRPQDTIASKDNDAD